MYYWKVPVGDVQVFNPGQTGVYLANMHFDFIPFVKHAFKTSPLHGSHDVESKPGLTENVIASFGSPPLQSSLLEPFAIHSVKVIGEN